MTYQTYTPWSDKETPKSIITLILITVLISLCSAALQPLFINVFKMNGPQEFFGLSWWGLSNLYLWQPLTAIFLQSEPSGIHFSFLIGLTFSMYMLWLFGSNLVETFGTKSFLGLYLISGILASLAAIMMVPTIRHFYIIAGCGASLLAIFVAWAMLHRNTQILLFFLIPVQAKLILTVVLVLAILIPLSQLNLVNFVYYITAILIGYVYTTIIWNTPSPYDFMQKIDDTFIQLGKKFRRKFARLFSPEKEESKIVDIKTGQAVTDDDTFIDEMLTKISRYGEKSLSWQEKDRMKKISEKKMKQK